MIYFISLVTQLLFEGTGAKPTSAFPPPHSWARLRIQEWGTRVCKLSFQANQHEERKPLKENRGKGSPKPENHYKVSRKDLPTVPIRAFLFSWVWEIWNPWEKLLRMFKARCSLVNYVLCLDVQNIDFLARLGIEGEAAEDVRSKQSSTITK